MNDTRIGHVAVAAPSIDDDDDGASGFARARFRTSLVSRVGERVGRNRSHRRLRRRTICYIVFRLLQRIVIRIKPEEWDEPVN